MSEPELPHPLPITQIGAGGTLREVVAGPQELLAIAARLGIPAVAALSVRFRLSPPHGSTIRAEGELRARVIQECIVTAEPFEAELVESFRIRFVPEADIAGEDAPIDLDSDDELPYRGGILELGEAAVEQLALALDPYPRLPGATLPFAGDAEDAPEHPFAALARKAGST
jgi:hypothetical protein